MDGPLTSVGERELVTARVGDRAADPAGDSRGHGHRVGAALERLGGDEDTQAAAVY
jgi:hypothetical protein